ncbi:MAG: bifunctional ornithine acetyltransferase/N-acetylglutamate synthase [Acidobacteria bacterium 13_1_20CM_2_65_9]|nr:MAG: bifunctional ornithine acetyltransferase/N-acetylglutamate synthase [Acidobacteria bacterium 13_1_20CM_2_65_9]
MPGTVITAPSGVTAAKGFRAAGVSCGIKAVKSNGGLDLALLVSETPAGAAAVFTTNLAQAAPILVSLEHLKQSGGTARAIVVNSGCANACTGDEGMQVARDMATETARLVNCPVEQVLVASTGVIGVALPIDKVRRGLPAALAALAAEQGWAAARAIMTTDPFPKEAATRVTIDGRDVAIGGMAKGSGMIEPILATMLGFVTTDAAMPQPLLDRALRAAVDDTFNAITVDGECSTNDCVMLLANGASGVEIDDNTYPAFVGGLRDVCRELALGIVRGGEGATKLITVTVTGAATRSDARRAAKAIANSPLVKTAIHGGDPNWGRLIAVAGRAGVAFQLSRAAVVIGSIVLFKNGRPHDEAAPDAAAYLQGKDIDVSVDLGAGQASSTVWTCDLSAEYVRINADYRT